MPSTKYHLTEPFPAPQRQYTGYGRGGAGNHTRNSRPTASVVESPSNKDVNSLQLTSSTEAYPPPRHSSVVSSNRPSTTRKTFTSGRGGWGNAHPASERAMFSFDEELERARQAERAMAPIYHIGVGGAGNIVAARNASSGDSTRSGSTSSADSERSFRERVKSRFSRMGSS